MSNHLREETIDECDCTIDARVVTRSVTTIEPRRAKSSVFSLLRVIDNSTDGGKTKNEREIDQSTDGLM